MLSERKRGGSSFSKGQMLTLDLLLALVPLTIIIGISASAIGGVASQAQEYVVAYGGQRVAIDAADVLVKTAGEPYAWNNDTVKTLGFAIFLGETGCPFSKPNTIISNIMDASKLSTFSQYANTSAVSAALRNLSGGSNIRILITNSTSTVVDVIGYKNAAGIWTVTSDSATINALMASAGDLFVAERTVGILELGVANWTVSITPVGSDDEGDELRGTPAIGDLDGVGTRELVVASGDGVYAYYSNGTQMWRYQPGDEFKRSSPALADLSGDSKPEVIIGSKNGKIYAIYGNNGTLFWEYTIASNKEIFSAPAVGDLDADGYPEIVAGDKETRVVVLNHDGTLLWSTTTPSGVKSSAAIADLYGDGSGDGLDFVIGAEDSKLYAFRYIGGGNFTQLWNYSAGGHVHSSPAARDIDNDGKVDVVVGSQNNSLYVLHGSNGSLKWSISAGDKISSSPALGDLNGDGKLDIVFGSEDKKVYAYSYDGTKLWEYTTGGKIKWSSPALADLDSDCKLEVVIGSADKKVYVLNHDGTLLWSYTTKGKIESSAVVADWNGDGYLEVIIPSEDRLYVFTTPGSGVEWPTFHQCIKRAGYYYDSACAGPNANVLSSGIAAKAVDGRLKVYIWR